jgi:hypothetical protein
MASHCTVVSGFFPATSKHDINHYFKWFENTLKVNAPVVFFLDPSRVDLIRCIRGDLPTYYVETTIADFYTAQYLSRFATHEVHVPSAELAAIWHEKINLIKTAFD